MMKIFQQLTKEKILKQNPKNPFEIVNDLIARTEAMIRSGKEVSTIENIPTWILEKFLEEQEADEIQRGVH